MASVIIRNKAKNRLAKILEQSFFDYGQTTMLRFLSELEQIEKRLSAAPFLSPRTIVKRNEARISRMYFKEEFQIDLLLSSSPPGSNHFYYLGFAHES